jgi:transposase
MVLPARLRKRNAAVSAILQCHGNIQRAAKQVGAAVKFVKKWHSHYKRTGNVLDQPRTGRPALFSSALKKEAEELLLAKQSCTKVIAQLVGENKLPAGTHRSTLYKNVAQHSRSLKCGPEVIVPKITPRTALNRLSFAKFHKQQNTEWCGVMAIDSCMFRMGRVGGRRRVWRRVGSTAGKPSLTKSGSVHVYAGITAFGKTQLVFATGTTGIKGRRSRTGKVMQGVGAEEFQEVLAALVPAAEDIFEAVEINTEWQLLMDKAPPHTAASTTQWLQQHMVRVVDRWPGNSPDLNPIENLWGWMKRKLYSKDVQTVEQLKQAIQEIWEEVPDDMLTRLMCSMPKRLQRVVDKQGHYIGM